MQREVSEVLKITIEIMLTSVLIGIIAMFGYMSHKIEVVGDRNNTAQVYMESASELYYYNSKIVKGSDVIDCLITFPRTYTFEIDISGDIYRFDHKAEIDSGEGLGIWKLDYINEIITSDEINNSFMARFIKNETGDVIEGIRFEME